MIDSKEFMSRIKFLTQDQLFKITEKELSINLRKEIDDSFNHISNKIVHITQEERERWNNMKVDTSKFSKEGLLFTPEEKLKLANIEEHANNYIHPIYNTLDTDKPYMFLTIDSNGHVLYADNAERVNVSANESMYLNGKSTDYFLKMSDPVLKSAPIIDTVENLDDKNQAVNVDFMKNHCLSSSFFISDSLDPVTDKLRFDSDSNMYYFNKNRGKWVRLNTSTNIQLDYDGKIKEKYFRHKFPNKDIGVIIPQFSISEKSDEDLKNLGFLPLDGSKYKRKDYPELWDYINDTGNGIPLVVEEDWNTFYNYTGSCGFFSISNDEFRLPLINNVEPVNYNVDDCLLGVSYENAYPSPTVILDEYSALVGENYYKSRLQSFYYPILNYQPISVKINDTTNESNFSATVTTKSKYKEYKNSFKGVFQISPMKDNKTVDFDTQYAREFPHDGSKIKLIKVTNDKNNKDLKIKKEYIQKNNLDELLCHANSDDEIEIESALYKQKTGTTDAIEFTKEINPVITKQTSPFVSLVETPTTNDQNNEDDFSVIPNSRTDLNYDPFLYNSIKENNGDEQGTFSVYYYYMPFDINEDWDDSHFYHNSDYDMNIFSIRSNYIPNIKYSNCFSYFNREPIKNNSNYIRISIQDRNKSPKNNIITYFSNIFYFFKYTNPFSLQNKFIFSFNSNEDITNFLNLLDNAVDNDKNFPAFIFLYFTWDNTLNGYKQNSLNFYLNKDTANDLKPIIKNIGKYDAFLCEIVNDIEIRIIKRIDKKDINKYDEPALSLVKDSSYVYIDCFGNIHEESPEPPKPKPEPPVPEPPKPKPEPPKPKIPLEIIPKIVIKKKVIKDQPIKQPTAYVFDNGENGDEFSFNYLNTKFFIKAK